MKALVHRIQAALDPSLLKEPWRSQVLAGADPMTGHCAVASEAAYHLLGGKAAGWTPLNLHHEGSSHWFLRHADGRILDITASQFKTAVPYGKGRGCGFQTPLKDAQGLQLPSKRAQVVIDRVNRDAVSSKSGASWAAREAARASRPSH